MEKVIYETRSSVAIFVIGLSISYSFIFPIDNLIFPAIGIITLFETFILFFCTKLKITDARIIGQQGLVMRKTLSSHIKDVKSIEIHQNSLGKLFDYGNIKICTSQKTVIFKNMPNPIGWKYILDNEINKNNRE